MWFLGVNWNLHQYNFYLVRSRIYLLTYTYLQSPLTTENIYYPTTILLFSCVPSIESLFLNFQQVYLSSVNRRYDDDKTTLLWTQKQFDYLSNHFTCIKMILSNHMQPCISSFIVSSTHIIFISFSEQNSYKFLHVTRVTKLVV